MALLFWMCLKSSSVTIVWSLLFCFWCGINIKRIIICTFGFSKDGILFLFLKMTKRKATVGLWGDNVSEKKLFWDLQTPWSVQELIKQQRKRQYVRKRGDKERRKKNSVRLIEAGHCLLGQLFIESRCQRLSVSYAQQDMHYLSDIRQTLPCIFMSEWIMFSTYVSTIHLVLEGLYFQIWIYLFPLILIHN